MIIRELRWSDLHDLTESYYRLYDERADGVPIGITLFARRPNHADQAVWFSGLYRRVLSGETVCRIAEEDGHAIGNCTVQRVAPSDDSETAHVGELGILVHRDFRGRGAGARLLQETLDACRGRFDLVRLSVFTINTRAIALYRRFGFETVGRLPAAVKREGRYYDEDLMVIDLRPGAAKG